LHFPYANSCLLAVASVKGIAQLDEQATSAIDANLRVPIFGILSEGYDCCFVPSKSRSLSSEANVLRRSSKVSLFSDPNNFLVCDGYA
jgi:hypothetical protein